MKKFNKLAFIPLFVLSLSVLAGCNLEVFADGDDLMTALNYGQETRMIYSMDDEYYTPNGRKVSKGDYKPVWRHIQNELNITLKEHSGAANSGEKKSVAYFRDNWLNKPYADVTMGTVDAITKYSMQGNKETIMDIKPFMFEQDENKKYIKETTPEGIERFKLKSDTLLPNLGKFLRDNPGVLNSITTSKHHLPDQSAVYYVPYFDGFDDLEKLTMVRADFIKRLLDDTTTFNDDDTIMGKNGKYKQHYKPYIIEKDGSNAPEYNVDVINLNNDGKEAIWSGPGETKGEKHTFKKNKTENIIVRQNKLLNSNEPTNTTALVQQFKNYINERYGQPGTGSNQIFEKYSDLFLSYRTCYDVDELVALMRIIKVSAKTLLGKDSTKEMVPWFPTEVSNQRSADLYRWAGQLFGIRGLESRTGYLYLNGQTGSQNIDKLHDCRGDDDIVKMCENLNTMYQEGLILPDFDDSHATGTTDGKFARELILNDGKLSSKYAGFMEYCYFQSEGNLNDDKDGEEWFKKKVDYRPIIGCVAPWVTNPNEKDKKTYMSFTESWASVKTSALCLRAGLVNTPRKLSAALRFVDYIFSPKGRAAYNFGPAEDGYYYPGDFNPDTGEFIPGPSGRFKEYKGKKIPEFTEKALEQNKEYDNYLRRYVGATIPMGYEKLYGMSYQLTPTQTQKGIDIVNKAVEAKTFKHVCIKDVQTEYKDWGITKQQESFYKIVPSTFVLTAGQNTAIANILDKNKLGSIFTDDSKSRFNIWDAYVRGTKESYAPSLNDYITTVRTKWNIDQLVTYYQDAYEYAVL